MIWTLVFTFIALPTVLWIWMSQVEAKAYRVSKRSIRLQKPLKQKIRILHLSDTHFAKKNPSIDRFFDLLSTLKYDYVFWTGDIIDNQDGISHCLMNLRKLKPERGIYAVYGNHDYYEYRNLDVFVYGFTRSQFPKNYQRHDLLHKALKSEGVHILQNQSECLILEGEKIWIHGLDDPVTRHARPRAIEENIDSAAVNILLTHSVDALKKIKENAIDISFSGHSHGGQIRFPLIGPIVTHTSLGKDFTSGVRLFRGARCVISKGIGTSHFFPARLLCPPEALLIELSGSSQ